MEIDFKDTKLEVKLMSKPKPELYIKSCKNNQWYPIDDYEYGVIAGCLSSDGFPKICYGYYDNDGFHAGEGRSLTCEEKGLIKYRVLMNSALTAAWVILLILSVPIVILVSILLHTYAIIKAIAIVVAIFLVLLVLSI